MNILNNDCDCQDPSCAYGGIERLVVKTLDKHSKSREDGFCELCKSNLSDFSCAPSFVCKNCKKGIANFKSNIDILKNALTYLCRTPRTQIYSYSFSPREKKDIYQYLFHEQAARCAICEIWWKDVKKQRKMHIDHDHIKGYVRGLLCIHCNMALGNFKDSPEAIANAIDNFFELEKNS
jgi:hypothetical protein